MSETEKPKKPVATEVIANIPRRDNAGPDKGGDPHMNWDDKPLAESKVWQSHKSAKPSKKKA
jgi:hypothetical protein